MYEASENASSCQKKGIRLIISQKRSFHKQFAVRFFESGGLQSVMMTRFKARMLKVLETLRAKQKRQKKAIRLLTRSIIFYMIYSSSLLHCKVEQAALAQLVEHVICNLGVVGPSPTSSCPERERGVSRVVKGGRL